MFFEYNIVNCGKNTRLIVPNNVNTAVGIVFAIDSVPIATESINKFAINKSNPFNKIELKLLNEFHSPDFISSKTAEPLKFFTSIFNSGANFLVKCIFAIITYNVYTIAAMLIKYIFG